MPPNSLSAWWRTWLTRVSWRRRQHSKLCQWLAWWIAARLSQLWNLAPHLSSHRTSDGWPNPEASRLWMDLYSSVARSKALGTGLRRRQTHPCCPIGTRTSAWLSWLRPRRWIRCLGRQSVYAFRAERGSFRARGCSQSKRSSGTIQYQRLGWARLLHSC